MKTDDYPGMRSDWEARQFGDFAFSARTRASGARTTRSTTPARRSQISMFNAVGGSTILYAAHFPRFHPSDFKARTLDGVADDWPIDYATLAPFYDLNARMMGVSGLAGDPMYPPEGAAAAAGPARQARRDARARLQRARLALVAVGQRDHHAGVRRARARASTRARASSGARRAPRSSTDITYWPAALRQGVRSKRAAACARSPSARTAWPTASSTTTRTASSAGSARTSSWSRATASARRASCCNSRSTHFPDGLANRSGLVGKNLMFHPYAMVTGIFDEPLEGYKGPTGCCIMSQEFYETDRVARLRCAATRSRSCAASGPCPPRCCGMSWGRMPWGADHHRAYAELFDRTAGMVAICEDLPEETNSRHARSGAHGRRRHPRAEDHLSPAREQHGDARARGRARRKRCSRRRGPRHDRAKPRCPSPAGI